MQGASVFTFGRAMAQAVSCLRWFNHVKFVMGEVSVRHVFLQVLLFSPISVMPPAPHTHFHLAVVLTRTGGEAWEPS